MAESKFDADTNGHLIARRRVLATLSGLGVGSVAFQRALAAAVEEKAKITPQMIQQAEWIAGLELTDDERNETARSIERALSGFQQLREVDVDHLVAPITAFNPAPWLRPANGVQRNQATLTEDRPVTKPTSDEDLAFLPVSELAPLLRTRQVTSMQLTKLYLERLRKYDRMLKCVVTFTEDLALRQAEQADKEIAAGRYRGPLHGVPWGAKDLMAIPGYPTTWGAAPFKDQQFDFTATVAERLKEAGAVLVAKLTLGALAMGDKWFGGMTRNPWNPDQGSSGSSAGSASAVTAGLVGFAIGTETLGSIVSPCRRCGSTGLRPTFGRVSRHGCMPLSWTMDKIGPITRSVEDCAIVLDAIHGFDGRDACAVDQPFAWPSNRPLGQLKVGYIKGRTPIEKRDDLKVLKELGVELIEIQLPKKYPANAMVMMLGAEAGTVFDQITRDHVTESLNSWPGTFRRAQFVPVVEYLRASRVRSLLIQEMREVMEDVDLYVGGNDLVICNLTGHPTVVMPNGFRDMNGRKVPGSLTLTGRLYGESDLLAVARAWQNATGHHLHRPPLDQYLQEADELNKS